MEGAFREVKQALAGRATQLRARDPRLAMGELGGLLLGCFVTRWAILQAAQARGVAPVAVSFAGALRVLGARLGAGPGRRGRRWWADALAALGRERVPPRRRRACPRKKKVTRCAWPAKKKQDVERPLSTLRVVTVPGP